MTIGKGQLSYRKKDTDTQKTLGVGFSKTVFAHEATGGESGISLASLNTPSSMSSQGFVQPSPGTLADLHIYVYRRNLTLISSLRGTLMDFLSYRVMSDATIKFNGFTLLPGEIITGIVDPLPKNDLMVVDGESIAATGTLAVGVTDFNVGTPFETNKYPSQQIGAVKVYRNGLLQARCEGNDSANLGNYTEVPATGGFGSVIRFVDAPVNQADNIIVTSNGAYFERPAQSQLAALENLGGQVDKIVEVLSDVSGLDETDFQSNPNQVDLRQFGDRVVDLENDVAQLTPVTYIDVTPTLTTSTLADTYEDVTGSTLVITEGIWEIVFEGAALLSNNSGGALNVSGNIGIFNSSNVLVDNALAIASFPSLAAGSNIPVPIRITARVSAGSYKLRIRSSAAAATAAVTAFSVSVTGSLTNPDWTNKYYAKKVGV